MNPVELWELINNGELDFEFGYEGKSGTICLCYLPTVYVIYDNKESETTLNELMMLKFIDGKSLIEVSEEIEFYG